MGVLPDRSFQLGPAGRSADGFPRLYSGNLTTLQACLQCGACTANCSLAGEHSLFPRRQMNLIQMGQHERLSGDPTIWQCYNCGECSTRCAADARPGKLMGAIRQMAVERFAFPAFLGGLINRPDRWWLVFIAAAALLLVAIGVGGSFFPARDHVHYASMLPHATLNLFFIPLTGLVAAALVVGAGRAWRSFQGESIWLVRGGPLLRSFRAALRDILAHRGLTDCAEHRRRGYAHLAVFYGFVGLAGLAGMVALMIASGSSYPFPAGHPMKILGNVAAALLILGTAYFVHVRRSAAKEGDSSAYFDWYLLLNLLLAGITGVSCEVLRYVNVPLLAYPVYFLHLLCVFALLVSLPYSKLAHVCYRTVALTSREYDALLAAEPAADIPAGRPLLTPALSPLAVPNREPA